MAEAVAWLAAYAAQRGLKYEPDADERWLRAWEPYVTLRTPIRYEHALLATGTVGSISVARFAVPTQVPSPAGGLATVEASAWIAIAQDERIRARAATANEAQSPFAEPRETIALPRSATGDPAFDAYFSTFASSADDLATALNPSVRRLLMSWRTAVHVDVRPGGFIIAPVALGPDAASLSWLLHAVHFFGEKATKQVR